MTALKEMARVMQPTGVLGLIWNIEDCKFVSRTRLNTNPCLIDNSPKSWEVHSGWESKMRDLIWSFDDDLPRFRHEKWRKVFDQQNVGNPLTTLFATPLFGLPIGESNLEWETWLSKDDVWKRYRTLSQIAILEGDELEKVKKQFFGAIDADDTTVDTTGKVPVHGRTVYAWTSKIPGEPLKSGG